MSSLVSVWVLDSDGIESLNYDRQTLEQEGTIAVVVRHFRNVPSKVTEKLETSVIGFNGNWYNYIIIILYIFYLIPPGSKDFGG